MTNEFFTANRTRLIDQLTDGIVVVSGHSLLQGSRDTNLPFQQEANFWYLSGIEEPDWWMIIDTATRTTYLVTPTLSDSHQIFDGGLSAVAATDISGVDYVVSPTDADTLLSDFVEQDSRVWSLGDDPEAAHYDFVLNPAPLQLWQRLAGMTSSLSDCRGELAALRAIKQPQEIAALQRAIDLTIDGFEVVKQKLSSCRFEYEVEAEFSYHFRRHGAHGHAYEPIVACGHNACTLHYIANNDPLPTNGLVLLDIGARLDGYAADITRTYALGTPTDRQRAVHLAVQSAHQQIIALLGPGVSVRQYHQHVDDIMKQALLSLQLMQSIDDDANYRRYFPHAISHGLGVDVHDSLGRPTVFAPGMVLTVEPGIYIAEESIGVRIEDDILITETGYRNLSVNLSTDL